MSRILISRLWLTTRHDGSQIIAGKFGWDGKIRIESNPDKQAEGDPDFLAFVEYQQPKMAPSPFRGPSLQAPTASAAPRALTQHQYVVEAEVVDPFAD
jgi:hypothetical protein